MPPVGSKTGGAVNFTLSSEYFQLQDRQPTKQPTNHVSHSENIILQFDCLAVLDQECRAWRSVRGVVINP